MKEKPQEFWIETGFGIPFLAHHKKPYYLSENIIRVIEYKSYKEVFLLYEKANASCMYLTNKIAELEMQLEMKK